MNNLYKIFSWLSVIVFIIYLVLLTTELFNVLALIELDILPIFLGVILLIISIISISVIRKKQNPTGLF